MSINGYVVMQLALDDAVTLISNAIENLESIKASLQDGLPEHLIAQERRWTEALDMLLEGQDAARRGETMEDRRWI